MALNLDGYRDNRGFIIKMKSEKFFIPFYEYNPYNAIFEYRRKQRVI